MAKLPIVAAPEFSVEMHFPSALAAMFTFVAPSGLKFVYRTGWKLVVVLIAGEKERFVPIAIELQPEE